MKPPVGSWFRLFVPAANQPEYVGRTRRDNLSCPRASSSSIAVYRGREMKEISSGPDFVTVHDDCLDVPDAIDRGDSGKGPWVRIPTSSCDRRYNRDVTATWDSRRVHVVSTAEGSAAITFQGDRNGLVS
jgi:hypothetical protein